MSRHRIAVCILNWNSADRTLECAAAVRRSLEIDVEILVVDNGSSDDSAARLTAASGIDRFLAAGENRGYAGGMNAGIESVLRESAADYLLLLTPDALVGPPALASLARALDEHPAAGIAGPLVVVRPGPDRLVDAGGAFEPRRARAPHLRAVRRREPYAVDWIDGCCMLMRREVPATVGLLDERYFLYFEETDYCCRAGRAGWEVLLVPDAEVLHEKDSVPGAYYFYYMVRNRYLFWEKNFGLGAGVVAAELARESGRMLASAARAALLPPRWRTVPEELRRLGRQIRGVAAGTRDFGRRRFGPMPGR